MPTEAGKLLLDHGRGILHQVERAREELGRVCAALSARIRRTLIPTFSQREKEEFKIPHPFWLGL